MSLLIKKVKKDEVVQGAVCTENKIQGVCLFSANGFAV